MKKIILVLFGITLLFLFSNHQEDILIPNNAIRFRVIANSNTLEDQKQKQIIKERIENEVYSLISNAQTGEQVKTILKDNMSKIEQIVENYNIPYQVNYGMNYFPTKNYKGVLYKAGDYESLVITLGKGTGSNFWCVLFPPLCLLDNDSEDVSDVKYQLYVKKILDKF